MKHSLLLITIFLCFSLFTFAAGDKEKAAAAEEVKKLVLWDVQTVTVLKDKIDSAAMDFMRENPGVQLEVVHIQNDPYKTKLKVVMGAGTPPDIFHNWGGGPLKEYIDSGMVATIDEIKADLLKTYIPAAFDPATFDGKTYGSPYAGLTGVFFWYRTDTFSNTGVSPPATYSDLFAVCDKLKAGGVTPITLANKTKWPGSFYYMYLADRMGGGDMFLNALYRKKGVTFEDPAYVKAGELLQDLVKRDYFPRGFNGMDYDTGQSRTMIYSSKAGMNLMGTWFLGAARKESPDVIEKIDFFPFPAVQGGKGNPTNLIGSPGQNYFSISTTCKYKEEALKWLKDYIMNKSWIEFMVRSGYVPPVKNSASYVTDPMLKQVAQRFEEAGHVQVYYDQFLPPAMGEKHKDLVQALFGLQKTSAEVAAEHEKAILEELKK